MAALSISSAIATVFLPVTDTSAPRPHLPPLSTFFPFSLFICFSISRHQLPLSSSDTAFLVLIFFVSQSLPLRV